MDDQSRLVELLCFYNPWWETGVVPATLALPYERRCLATVLSRLRLDRIVLIKGPRRTGKTTLLYQMIRSLMASGVRASQILYLSFDEIATRVPLDDIIAAYETVVKRSLSENKAVYFFLDEVQLLDNWSLWVKRHFDTRTPLRFIASGSSASLLRKGTESLAGRTVEEVVLPFTFREYVAVNDPHGKLARITSAPEGGLAEPGVPPLYVPHRSRLRILFDDYLRRGGFPHLFGVEDDATFRRLLNDDIIGKVLYRDLVELFGIKQPLVLEKLFLYLADISSGLLNVSNVSRSLGLSREYVEKYVEYLRSAYLVFGARKYSRSVEASVRAAEKIYVVDPALCRLAGRKEPAFLAETVVARHLFGRAVSYWRNKYEVDFVLEDGKCPTPIEVKYQSRIDADDLKGLRNFMEKFRVKRGIVLTRDFTGEMKVESGQIVCKPVSIGLLQMC